MGSDVRRTGLNGDLEPTDTIVDDMDSPELLRQQIDDLLHFQRGECVFDSRIWIDWLGIREAKVRTPESIAEEIRRALVAIETIHSVTVNVVGRDGRQIIFSIAVVYAKQRLEAQMRFALSADYDKPGSNGVGQLYFVAR